MVNLQINNKHYATILPNGDRDSITTAADIFNYLQSKNFDDYYLIHNGHLLKTGDIHNGDTIHIVPRIYGGKGGFGSMLRAIGAQIEKTTNREACRDLSGRRLRDINEEKRLKKWIAEQADRERETAEKKKKKLEKLSYEPKHEFKDEDYDKVRLEMVEKVHSAVEEGLKASATSSDNNEPSTSKGVKRKLGTSGKEKGMLWMDEEFGSDVSDSDEDSIEDKEEEKKKLRVE